MKAKRIFDDRGNQVEEEYFGVDGTAVAHVGGYWKKRDEFDERWQFV